MKMTSELKIALEEVEIALHQFDDEQDSDLQLAIGLFEAFANAIWRLVQDGDRPR